jgi:uncharacterized membrane protein
MNQTPTKQHIQEDANDPDPIYENIRTIVELHKRAENEASGQQRTKENITAFLGRPRFLFIILIFVSLWIMVNILLMKFGLPDFDPPPFMRGAAGYPSMNRRGIRRPEQALSNA